MFIDEAERMPYENMFVWNFLLTTQQQQMDNFSRAWIIGASGFLAHGVRNISEALELHSNL